MLMIIVLIAYIYFSYMSRYRYSYRMSSVETGKFIYVNFSRLRYLVDKDWAMSQGYLALKQSFLTHLERAADKQRKGSHHMIVHLLSVVTGNPAREQTKLGEFSAVSRGSSDVSPPVPMSGSASFFEDCHLQFQSWKCSRKDPNILGKGGRNFISTSLTQNPRGSTIRKVAEIANCKCFFF